MTRPALVTAVTTAMLLAAAATPAPPTPDPSTDLTAPATGWHLLWHDEFDGDTLDRKTWATTLPFKGDDGVGRHHNKQYLSALTDDDVRVHDGVLSLTSRKADVTTAPGHTYAYTEGFAHTAGHFAYQYGYLEARCRGTTGQGSGFWPAVWTLADHAWPPENDVVELWSSGHMHQGFAFRSIDGTAAHRSRVYWISRHTDACPPGWHTYGLEWGPGYERFTFDGRVTRQAFGTGIPSRPMYVILNSGVSDDRNRAPTAASRWPMTFDVDYVRVYQKADPKPILFDGTFADADADADTQAALASVAAAAWRLRGDAKITPGSAGVRIPVDSSAEQWVGGLHPGGRYTFSAAVAPDVGPAGVYVVQDGRPGLPRDGSTAPVPATGPATATSAGRVSATFTARSDAAVVGCRSLRGTAVFTDARLTEAK